MNFLSSHQRQSLLAQLSSTHFDLLVIGGGITGCGIALDAAARGMKVGLVEMRDFASGTSSRSTKLIHGGLRYLKQFEIALVREVGRERATVHKLAPHLVVSEKMLLPIVENGTFGKFLTSVGLMVYDVLAGVESVDQRVMLSKEKTLKEEPLLDESILKGSGLYAEYRTDDARLTIEVLKTAFQHGAMAANYVKVQDFIYEDGQVQGAKCTDEITGNELSIRADYIISAAGPWVDKLRAKDNSLEGKRLHLTKGVHLVVPHHLLPLNHSVYFDVPDGRMIFAIPRQKVTYIGTTDTEYHGDINHVITNQEDAQYLLDAVNNFFPSIKLKIEDVISSWAGLRPLIHEDGKSASELSRKDEIFESPNGLISIAGGKLTGYRKMAERVVDVVAKKMEMEKGVDLKASRTQGIVLSGGAYAHSKDVAQHREQLSKQLLLHGLGIGEANYLVANYGKQADVIVERFLAREKGDPRRNLLMAELSFCLQHEMILHAQDFCTRRTGRLYFDIDSLKAHGGYILEEMGRHLAWNAERLAAERADLQQAIHEAQNFPPIGQSTEQTV